MQRDLVIAIIGIEVFIKGFFDNSEKEVKYGLRIFDVCTLTIATRLIGRTMQDGYDGFYNRIWNS